MRVGVFEGEGVGVGEVGVDEEVEFGGEGEEGGRAGVGGGGFETVSDGHVCWVFLLKGNCVWDCENAGGKRGRRNVERTFRKYTYHSIAACN